MTASPKPHAPVLRRHRLAALLALYPHCNPDAASPELQDWLSNGGDHLRNCNPVAQLAADCEARGEPLIENSPLHVLDMVENEFLLEHREHSVADSLKRALVTLRHRYAATAEQAPTPGYVVAHGIEVPVPQGEGAGCLPRQSLQEAIESIRLLGARRLAGDDFDRFTSYLADIYAGIESAAKPPERTCKFCGMTPLVTSEGQCQNCGEPSK